MLSWHFITRAQYDAAQAVDKTADKLFFLSDTKEIYRGTQLFTESVVLYTDEPTVKAVGRLYVNATTLEGKTWDGAAWHTVIKPVQASLTASDTANPVSGKAVADYVAAELAKVTGSGNLVAGVAYDKTTNKLTVTMADDTTSDLPLEGVAVDLVYDATTGKLNVKNASGTVIGTGINLALERFVSSATYDADAHKITLAFNDSDTPLEIDVADLVDTYTAKGSSTISMTVTGNEFTAEAILATGKGEGYDYSDNQLVKTDKGLYVAATDISGKVDKVSNATAGNIATLTAEGGVADGGVKVGGATLAEAPTASMLATEAAVAAIRTALTTAIDGKMAKVGTGHEDELLAADATGDAKASGVKVGGENFKDTPDATTAATELGVANYVAGKSVLKSDLATSATMATTSAAASDAKIPSEKAVVDALTWKTTV